MIIKDGKVHYARIGIALAPLTPALARQLGLDEGTKGVLVGDVVPGSPADKAGLKQGDVITGFAGEKVQDRSVVPAQGGHQRGLQVVRASATSATARTQKTSIIPAPADKVVFEVEQGEAEGEAREGRARQDRDQRLRPGSPAADRRAGQAARASRRPQGCRRLLGQGGQPRRRGRDPGRRRHHQGRPRPQDPAADQRARSSRTWRPRATSWPCTSRPARPGRFVTLSQEREVTD